MLNVDEAGRRLRDRSIQSRTESFRGTACLLWTGHVDREGYPNKVQVDGVVTSAHRMAYWVEFGPIPPGLQIDHVCHDPELCVADAGCPHRRCINPKHLRAVTPRENTLRSGGVAAVNARATTCVRGHPWDKVHATGRRRCSTCEQELGREQYRLRSDQERRRRNERRRELDADEARHRRKNRAAWLAKRGLRPDECLNGHPYADGSFRIGPSGKRACIACTTERDELRQRSAALVVGPLITSDEVADLRSSPPPPR